jgi:hypothetical protein
MAKIIVKLSVLVFVFIALSIFGFVVYYSVFYYVFQNDYLASYSDKIGRLESLRYTKKAVFIGGSATHFGIQAELFEQETSIPSVNMGLHGGVSFQIYMDTIVPYLNKGDTVFLCPEYEYYSAKFDSISSDSINLIYLHNPAILKNINLLYMIKSVPETFTYGLRLLKYIPEYLASLPVRASGNNIDLGNYRRDYSDTYGDYKGIKNSPNAIFEIYHAMHYDDKMFMSVLDKYLERLVKEDIEIYLLFPPITHSLVETSNTEIEKIYSRILSSKNIKLLFLPQDVIYNNNDFFDTAYHLNYDAAIKYTQYIISKYKKQE